MKKSGQNLEMHKLSNKMTGDATEENNILLDLKESKRRMIKRVCCIPIKKEWTIRRQMLTSIVTLFLCVCVAISLAIVINILVSRTLILSSVEREMSEQINNNMKKSLNEFAEAIQVMFRTYYSKLDMLALLFLSAYDEVLPIWNREIAGEYPIVLNKSRIFSFYNDLTEDLETDPYVRRSFYKTAEKLSFRYWTYGVFGNEVKDGKYDNMTLKTENAKRILESLTVLNYFSEDVLYNRNVTNITMIYFGFEESKIFVNYPGMKMGLESDFYKEGKFDPTSRPWYRNSKDLFEKDKYTNAVISTPYVDFLESRKVVTISQPVYTQKNRTFLGVIALDIVLDDFQTLFDKVRFIEGGQIILTNDDGYVINNPFKKNETNETIYKINNTTITNLSDEDWEKIKDEKTGNETLEISSNRTEKLLAIRCFNYWKDQERKYILILLIPESKAREALNGLKTMMDEGFTILLVIVLVTISASGLILMISACHLTNKIVKPLTQLTDYAKKLNANNSEKALNERIKNELESLKADDIIGQLIEAFKNLIKGMAGLKKNNTQLVAGNDKAKYPINFYHGQKMPWRVQLKDISNFDSPRFRGANSTNGKSKF